MTNLLDLKEFEPEDSLPPCITRLIKECQTELKLNKDELKQVFIISAETEYNQLMHLSPEDGANSGSYSAKKKNN